jgi:hypothetical protein
MVNGPAGTKFHRSLSGIPDGPKVPGVVGLAAQLPMYDLGREL